MKRPNTVTVAVRRSVAITTYKRPTSAGRPVRRDNPRVRSGRLHCARRKHGSVPVSVDATTVDTEHKSILSTCAGHQQPGVVGERYIPSAEKVPPPVSCAGTVVKCRRVETRNGYHGRAGIGQVDLVNTVHVVRDVASPAISA